MSTFTLPIKPLVVAIALGVTQTSLAIEPSSCNEIIAIDTLTTTAEDGLTSFNEAWSYVVDTCSSIDTSEYTIQFDRSLNGSTIELSPLPYILDGNRTLTLSLQAKEAEDNTDQLPVELTSSDATKNIFLIKGSKSFNAFFMFLKTL